MSYKKNEEFRHAESKMFALSLSEVGIVSGLGIGAVGLAASLLLHSQSTLGLKVAGLVSVVIFLVAVLVLFLTVHVYSWIFAQEMANGLVAAERAAFEEVKGQADVGDVSSKSFENGARFLSEYLQGSAGGAARRIVGYSLLAMVVSFLVSLVGVIKIAFV